MTRWMRWMAAGCCFSLLAAAGGCGERDLSGPKTAAETKSFNGGPMPPNSRWAKKLQADQNARQNFKPLTPAGAAANTPAPPKTL